MWPPSGLQVAYKCPPSGLQVSSKWPPSGFQVASKWPPSGIQVASKWPPSGLQVASKWSNVCAFHLRNREAKRELNVVWNGTRLSNTTTPVYLGIHLDRTLCYKTHIEKTKMKVNARNNIIHKLANSMWRCKSLLGSSCIATDNACKLVIMTLL